MVVVLLMMLDEVVVAIAVASVAVDGGVVFVDAVEVVNDVVAMIAPTVLAIVDDRESS